MQLKTLSKRALVISFVTGFALVVVLSWYFLPQIRGWVIASSHVKPEISAGNITEPLAQEQVRYGVPLHLKIPAINVDAVVEGVGLTQNGTMDTPKNPKDVAWFNLGTPPGENGSAVIDGHYGWKDGKPSVFDDLYKLRKGDKIYIQEDNGVTVTFVVQGDRRYNPQADASAVFNSSDGKSHLNLITCEGTWDKASGSYSLRLVVFADKEI